ncbi:MAG: YceI family protein [Oligoflexales bacterium]|nr:YceI family protein [Oligoflexales bacterium]
MKNILWICSALLALGLPQTLLSSDKMKDSVEVEVSLSPAGSFTVTSENISGKGIKKGDTISAEKIEVPIDSLKTGIDLRDEHLRKKLTANKKIKSIIATQILAKNNKGTAKISILGHEKPISFEYHELLDGNKKPLNQATAEFNLSLKDFEINGISYMGLGVEDEVVLKVTISY